MFLYCPHIPPFIPSNEMIVLMPMSQMRGVVWEWADTSLSGLEKRVPVSRLFFGSMS